MSHTRVMLSDFVTRGLKFIELQPLCKKDLNLPCGKFRKGLAQEPDTSLNPWSATHCEILDSLLTFSCALQAVRYKARRLPAAILQLELHTIQNWLKCQGRRCNEIRNG